MTLNVKYRDLAGLSSRIVLGGVMLVAGAVKLPDPASSVRAVRAYQALPEAVVPMVGYALPIVELILGVMLIIGALTRTAAVTTAALQVVFIAGISWAWIQGLEIDCGCFGGGGELEGASKKYPFDIARDVGFIALAVAAWKWPAHRWSVDRFLTPSVLAHDVDQPTTNLPVEGGEQNNRGDSR